MNSKSSKKKHISTHDLTFYLLSNILISSISFSLLLNWILASYFKVDVAASLMYQANDGWCNAKDEGIGVHCFGDFNERFNPSINDQWPAFPNNLETTPVGPFITSIANLALNIFSSRTILIGFYLLSFALLIYPLLNALKSFDMLSTIKCIGYLGVASYPFLVLMDRLNYLVFSVPLLYFLYKYSEDIDCRKQKKILIILGLVKPQFILLGLIYLFRYGFKKYFTLLIMQISSLAFLILLAGKGDFSRLLLYGKVIAGYGGKMWSFNTPNPPNSSLANVLYTFFSFIHHFLTGRFFTTTKYTDLVFVICAAFISFSLILFLWIKAGKLTNLEILLILTIISVLGFGKYVASYYFIFTLPLISVVLNKQFELKFAESKKKSHTLKIRSWFFLLAYFFSSTTILFPNLNFKIIYANNLLTIPILNPVLACGFWFLYIFATINAKESDYAVRRI